MATPPEPRTAADPGVADAASSSRGDESVDELRTGDGEASLSADSPSLAFLRQVAQVSRASPDPFERQLSGQPLGALDLAAFGSRFQVRQRLGVGGFGAVYEALDLERGATVALKVLRRHDGASISRFKQEFRSLAETSHEHLVQLYELHAEGDAWFFTMELIRGQHTLAYLRPAGGPLDESRLRPVFCQLATGLNFLHRSGKLHRDIKPSNVLVTEEGRVVLVDFGLVQDRADLPASQGVQGTPAYMAPEQAAGAPAAAAADWYAVGVMLFEALSGRLPRPGEELGASGVGQTGIIEELDSLCRELLSPNPEARPSGREVLRRLALDDEGPQDEWGPELAFVGRKTQLAALEQALAATDRGAVTTALLRGAAGLGKSALLRRFREELRAEDPGRLVLLGRCFEQESVPFKGVDGLLDDLCRQLRERQRAGARLTPPPESSSLARLFPQLGEILGVYPEPGGADALTLRSRAFAALRALLGAQEGPPPVLLVDDLQWGDQDSVALLAALLAGPAPILLVCAYRAEESERNEVLRTLFATLEALGERMNRCTIEVDRLAAPEAEDLARGLLAADGRADGALAVDTLAALLAEGQGNPLLLAELSRRPAVPHALDLGALLRERIGRLPGPAQRLLEVLAVEGQPLSRAVAARASYGAEGASAALGAVSVLRAERLIRGLSAGRGEEIVAYHDRIAEVVRAGLAADLRRDHHLQLALAFEALGTPEPERLLVHLKGADRPGEAAPYAALAARRAHEALAFDRAARLYREALTLRKEARIEEISNAAELDRPLRVALADALTAAGRPRDAAQAYLDAARGASPGEAQPLSRRAAELLLGAGYVDEGLSTIREVLRELGVALPSSLPGTLLGYLWHRLRLRVRGQRFTPRSEGAVGERDLRRIDASYAATLGLFLVNPILAVESQGRHLLLALSAGEPRRVARALGTEAIVTAVRQGAGPETERLLARAGAIEAQQQDPRLTGYMSLCRGHVAYTAGQWRLGHDHLLACETLLRRECADAATEIDLARIQRANLLWALGEVETLRQLVPALVEEARERDSRLLEMMVRLGPEPNLALAGGRPDLAREALARAHERWPLVPGTVLHVREVGSRARIALYEGQPELALRWVEQGFAAMRRTGLRFVRSQTAELHVWRGLAALSLGDLRQAERDAETLSRLQFPWVNGAARFVRAGVARRAGDLPLACSLLRQNLERARDGDSPLYVAVMSRRLGEWTGGEELASADAWMATRGVADPERLTATLLGWV